VLSILAQRRYRKQFSFSLRILDILSPCSFGPNPRRQVRGRGENLRLGQILSGSPPSEEHSVVKESLPGKTYDLTASLSVGVNRPDDITSPTSAPFGEIIDSKPQEERLTSVGEILNEPEMDGNDSNNDWILGPAFSPRPCPLPLAKHRTLNISLKYSLVSSTILS
jgi:hypothetical protein